MSDAQIFEKPSLKCDEDKSSLLSKRRHHRNHIYQDSSSIDDYTRNTRKHFTFGKESTKTKDQSSLFERRFRGNNCIWCFYCT